MIINQTKSVDVIPEIRLDDDTILEVEDEIKLLGVIVRSQLKWQSNTKNINSKGFARIWLNRNY